MILAASGRRRTTRLAMAAAGLFLLALAGADRPPAGDGARAVRDGWRARLEARMAEGDLLFRVGIGARATAVRVAQAGSELSHVGMVFRRSGQWEVLHAAPGRGVIAEPLARYLDEASATGFALYRGPAMAGRVAAMRRAATAELGAHRPFDDDFDLADHRKLYCTEYVWLVLTEAGLHPARQVTHVPLPLAPMDVMLPVDLIHAARLVPVVRG